MAVNTPLSSSFIDRFTCGVFSSEHETVPRRFRFVAILSTQQHQRPSNLQEVTPLSKRAPFAPVKWLPIPICIAKRVVLDPHTQHRVLVTVFPFGIPNVKRIVSKSCKQMIPTAIDVENTLSLWPFHVLLSNFFCKRDAPIQIHSGSICYEQI